MTHSIASIDRDASRCRRYPVTNQAAATMAKINDNQRQIDFCDLLATRSPSNASPLISERTARALDEPSVTRALVIDDNCKTSVVQCQERSEDFAGSSVHAYP